MSPLNTAAMIEKSVRFVWYRLRPREGWLSLFLLSGIITSLIMGVLEADWVPEAAVVIPAAALGLLMGLLLAKRPVPAWAAAILLLLYGMAIITIDLADLLPPLALVSRGWAATSQFWRQNTALFLDRIGGWLRVLSSGGRSQETLPFAFGLAFLAWSLSAYSSWSIFRLRRPLLGLTAAGVAFAVNSYYGQVEIYWSAFFAALTALLAALIHFTNLEERWRAEQIDFSEQIRMDLILFAAAVAAMLLGLALLLPAFPVSKLSRVITQSPPIRLAEEKLEQLFAGVRQPLRRGSSPGPDQPGGRGILPRDYLIGDPPQLYQTVMMTAAAAVLDENENSRPQDISRIQEAHWRGPSYDQYTGRGWALSDEGQLTHNAGEELPLPAWSEQILITQTISWVHQPRSIRYTLGLPRRFEQPVTSYWRGREDLSRVSGADQDYTLISQVSRAAPASLRLSQLSDIPAAAIARYTALPFSVPIRVRQLAQEIAGSISSPYDQALALEQFLRQYPYTLNVTLPPDDVDLVDFFLFEQQSGYCDYYASAMVVMARALGLPARIGVGFLAQPPDENGRQVIYQINSHSWAEIYFAGYGWIEFEPTPAFASPQQQAAAGHAPDQEDSQAAEEPQLPPPPAIPDPAPQRPFPWRRVSWIILAALASYLYYRRWQRRFYEPDRVKWAYGQLQMQAQRLGCDTPASQTPAEFTTHFLSTLDQQATHPTLVRLVAAARPHVHRLADLFIARQYSRQKQSGTAAALESWQMLRRPMWLMRARQMLPWRKE